MGKNNPSEINKYNHFGLSFNNLEGGYGRFGNIEVNGENVQEKGGIGGGDFIEINSVFSGDKIVDTKYNNVVNGGGVDSYDLTSVRGINGEKVEFRSPTSKEILDSRCSLIDKDIENISLEIANAEPSSEVFLKEKRTELKNKLDEYEFFLRNSLNNDFFKDQKDELKNKIVEFVELKKYILVSIKYTEQTEKTIKNGSEAKKTLWDKTKKVLKNWKTWIALGLAGLVSYVGFGGSNEDVRKDIEANLKKPEISQQFKQSITENSQNLVEPGNGEMSENRATQGQVSPNNSTYEVGTTQPQESGNQVAQQNQEEVQNFLSRNFNKNYEVSDGKYTPSFGNYFSESDFSYSSPLSREQIEKLKKGIEIKVEKGNTLSEIIYNHFQKNPNDFLAKQMWNKIAEMRKRGENPDMIFYGSANEGDVVVIKTNEQGKLVVSVERNSELSKNVEGQQTPQVEKSQVKTITPVKKKVEVSQQQGAENPEQQKVPNVSETESVNEYIFFPTKEQVVGKDYDPKTGIFESNQGLKKGKGVINLLSKVLKENLSALNLVGMDDTEIGIMAAEEFSKFRKITGYDNTDDLNKMPVGTVLKCKFYLKNKKLGLEIEEIIPPSIKKKSPEKKHNKVKDNYGDGKVYPA